MTTHKCDQCDKPATTVAIDVIRNEDPGAAFASFAPVGDKKFGCDEHPAKSVEQPR